MEYFHKIFSNINQFIGGSPLDVYREIDEYIFKKFMENRKQRIRVHDRNLTRWGAEKGRELGTRFRASLAAKLQTSA